MFSSPHSLRHAYWLRALAFFVVLAVSNDLSQASNANASDASLGAPRERISLNSGWKFSRSTANPDKLAYDLRSDIPGSSGVQVLRPWILPSANDFISDPSKHHRRPAGDPPGSNVPFVQKTYNDSGWDTVDLPHDWAIKGPFYTDESPLVGGGMGRLPVHGVGWYRRRLRVTEEDMVRSIYLEVDGAMSYAMVWLNGNLVGGWPYGYTSFRLELTPYLEPGDGNQLAIRLDNPVQSSRWYPGGGIYRNVWLTKVNHTHIGQWGTTISSGNVSTQTAALDITVRIENSGTIVGEVEVATEIYKLDPKTGRVGDKVQDFPRTTVSIAAGQQKAVNSSVMIDNPRLWGPRPKQQPNMYSAITSLIVDGITIDSYETQFGIRSLVFDAEKGLLVNGEEVRIQGVNEHHDLGAIGSAFNVRAAERKLEVLGEMGCKAIRMSHNPPAPEFLDLTDRMGFLVMDEALDSWERQKTANDYHLIFGDWHEADIRSMIRRDRNHVSIFAWSAGNEVGEQTSGSAGAAMALRLCQIVHSEDPGRPCTASMNAARPDMPFPRSLDLISLNYQGEGIRDTPPYAGLEGIKTHPLYPDFHKAFPDKMILSSETAAALSTRGTYFFPVTNELSAPANDRTGGGGNGAARQVSAYELYTTPFGASPDKVFSMQDRHPFVAGEFVWSGWDYLGEPTPYYSARSSYFGIVDLAGFKKDRFYLYQARWRPDLPTAHILPHWTWPERTGQVTPVHVFSAADEAELFLNGESQGRKTIGPSSYRFRWDDVVYRTGELKVVTYRNNTEWATDVVQTAGAASQIRLTADRMMIAADGSDLSFVTAEILDSRGDRVPHADNTITFTASGAGEIVASDNGNPADMTSFASSERRAFSGLALLIIRAKAGSSGPISVAASSPGLASAQVDVQAGPGSDDKQ
ncbi:hypothetical protein MFIFM68171_03928 [Madurella fahalii]|uniref:Beta-galactosidase n=1 Tax=Madurella fahalii TaxID=1157608 RepID=A0ABQ0G7I1_9PEZI